MAWYNKDGNDKDIILSSRVRFARNLVDYPFASRMDDTSANEIIEKIESALGGALTKRQLDNNMLLEARSLAERHIISPDFAEKKTPHALFSDDAEEVFLMACEEDHIRLQCIKSGYDLDGAYKKACEYDDILESALKIAYDSELGYLTHCPTNLGTGMRASVMMFLPALTHARKIDSLSAGLSKLGLTIRGMFGEGSSPAGMLYQISNQITLGISEENTISKLKDVVVQICELENKQRELIKEHSYDATDDKVSRSKGLLKYAKMMSSGEFMKLYSDVRLGISLGMIEDIDLVTLDTLLVEILPATLILSNSENERPTNEIERDKLRARFIRSKL